MSGLPLSFVNGNTATESIFPPPTRPEKPQYAAKASAIAAAATVMRIAERLGTLVASGLIVGESLWGVINAGLIVGLSKDAPIGLVPEEFVLGPWLGLVGFVGVIFWLYSWMLRRSAAARRA